MKELKLKPENHQKQTQTLKMSMSLDKNIIAIAVLSLFSFAGFSQEKELGTEVVEIIKPYSPSISDAFKIKEIPAATDTVSVKKKEVNYTINSVPVASTFTPEKGKAANVEKAKKEKVYDNYARLGFGNYTTLLGELYSNFNISNEENVGFFFRHNSSQGKIKDALLDDKYYDTRLDANYANNQQDFSYGFGVGVEHQLYNWYGVPKDLFSAQQLSEIDPAHSFFGGSLSGNIAFDNKYLDKARLKLRYLGDSYSSSEFQVTLKPEFSFPMDNLEIRVDADVDYLAGSFDSNFEEPSSMNYGFFKAGVIPAIAFSQNDLSLSLGVGVYAGIDTKASESDFSFYPKVNASYRLDEAIIVYAGADGGITQNSYYNFKEENPFVSPTLFIVPTKNVYEGFAGIKGTYQSRFGYNFKASYGKDEGRALFQLNQGINPINAKGYHHNNSFHVVYDDVTTLSVFGELQVTFSELFTLGVNANYFNYETESKNPAWNLPSLTASVFGNFNITDAFYGGFSLFYVGERKDGVLTFGYDEIKLDGYADANLHLGYRMNERLSFFLRGNNLFNDNYKKWVNYQVQGIQGMIGATYKFDWQ
ncbi:MAG TPA: TonB-dependent receptor [Flavobacteriaceae bacterium]|nr:TonB-dependent receptor [Flavobacteriaceae bacterium]